MNGMIKKKNGFVQAVKTNIRIIIFHSLLLISACSGGRDNLTNDDEELSEYKADIRLLEKEIVQYIDSSWAVSETKLLGLKVDTILYGPQNKISFLVLIKRYNPNIYGADKSEIIGRGYIGFKQDQSFDIIKELKYKITGSNSYLLASKSLRAIYFKELEYLPEKFNINDERFWSSSIWE